MFDLRGFCDVSTVWSEGTRTVVRRETDLSIARVCIEDIGEELARAGHAGHDQTVDVVAVDDKVVGKVHGIAL